jgi:hypothetical protein
VNEDELVSMLNTLELSLIQIGMSSLVTQERISAVEGRAEKLTAQDIAAFRGEWSRQGTGKSLRIRTDDVRVRRLTAGERLAELLDLIEAAVGGTYAIETRLRNYVKSALDIHGDTWSGQVVFADPPESEVTGATPGERTLPDESTLQEREAAVREAISLVNQLRERAELPRSERLHTADAPDVGTRTDSGVPGDWL